MLEAKTNETDLKNKINTLNESNKDLNLEIESLKSNLKQSDENYKNLKLEFE